MDFSGLRVPLMMSVFLPILQLLLISIHGAVSQPIEPALAKNTESDDISRSKLYSILSQLYHDGRFGFSDDKIQDTDDSNSDNDLKRAHAGWQIAYGKRYSNKWGMAYGKRKWGMAYGKRKWDMAYGKKRSDDNGYGSNVDMDPSLADAQQFDTWEPEYAKRQQGWHIAYGKRST